MKLIITAFILLIVSPKGISQDNYFIPYNICNLILENRIPVLDSNKNPIHYQEFINTFYQYDTVINCSWTRPKFVNNIFHSSFDGVVPERSVPLFDTITFSTNPTFIAFLEVVYDDNGNFIRKEWAFMIDRNKKPLSLKCLEKKIIKEIKPQKSLSKVIKLIQTNKDECWVNERFQIGSFNYSIDRCMSKYALKLNSDYKFTQDYSKDSFCIMPNFAPEIKVGVEDSAERFYKYYDSVQFYKIRNPKGYWTIKVDSNKRQSLLLFSKHGELITKYRILNLSHKKIVLSINNQMITLKRIKQK